MESLDLQVLDAVLRWHGQGRRFALVTVAQTWGSAPRQPGAWLAICDDGRVQGSVSGGCIEDDLIERVRRGELAHHGALPECVTYGGHREASHRFGLPCGGTLALVVESCPDLASLLHLQAGIREGRRMCRRIDLMRGTVQVLDATGAPEVQWDGQVLATTHGPSWRLLLIGANPVARCLVPIAHSLGFAVSVCDPREEYHAEWDLVQAPWLPGMPDDVVVAQRPDPNLAVVALTHDPKLDDMALLEALKSPAFYVGALGSRVNSQARRDRLRRHFDLTEAEVGRLHGPIGVPIGSRTPAEIAVSIAAELVSARQRSRQGLPERAAPEPRGWPAAAAARSTACASA